VYNPLANKFDGISNDAEIAVCEIQFPFAYLFDTLYVDPGVIPYIHVEPLLPACVLVPVIVNIPLYVSPVVAYAVGAVVVTVGLFAITVTLLYMSLKKNPQVPK